MPTGKCAAIGPASTPKARQAAAPGAGPALVFLVVATAFAAEAALLGQRAVGLAALGTVLALLPLLRLSGTASSSS